MTTRTDESLANPSPDKSVMPARERSLLGALAFCLMDVALIGTAATLSNSLTILSDFLKELGDTTAVLAAWATVRAVRRAPTHQFAYGIGKLENLVSISIMVLMLVAGGAIGLEALSHLDDPVPTQGTLPGIAVFAAYAAIGFTISARQYRLLREEHSPIIASQARLWLSKAVFDALMATALGLALLFREQAWSLYLDPMAALVGAAFMMHSAWKIGATSVGDLLDAALEESLQIEILRCLVLHFNDYDDLHRIRTRRSGARIHVELTLAFDESLSLAAVLDRIDRMRDTIARAIPGADIIIAPQRASPA